MDAHVRNLNALLICIYCGIITSAFGIQIFMGEQPCPLCYLQRVGMIAVCMGAFFNLWFGVSSVNYSLSLLSSLVGGGIAMRQILLHICPGFPEFGEPVFGISLYGWSFISFVCTVFYISILLLFYNPSKPAPLNYFQRGAIAWLFLIVTGNVISVLVQCGLGACPE